MRNVFGLVSLVCLLAVPLVALPAQENLPASVFVETDPLGASLRLDGQIRAEKTPVLLRGLKVGSHVLQVYKDGYVAQTVSVQITPDKVAVLKVPLAPASVIVAFPANGELTTPASTKPTIGQQFRLPAGRFDLASDTSSVQARPVFDDEALAAAAPWITWGLLTSAALSTGFDLYAMQTYQSGIQPSTPILWVAFAGDLLWNWMLGDRQARFHKSKVPTFEPLNEKAEFAGPLASRADAALQAGELATATALFGQLVREFPDSAEVPTAWFRLARLHSLQGERALARGEYRLLAETLQTSAWHDRAHKTLADMDTSDGNFPEALYHLRQMTFADPFFARADIEAEVDRLTKLSQGEAAVAP